MISNVCRVTLSLCLAGSAAVCWAQSADSTHVKRPTVLVGSTPVSEAIPGDSTRVQAPGQYTGPAGRVSSIACPPGTSWGADYGVVVCLLPTQRCPEAWVQWVSDDSVCQGFAARAASVRLLSIDGVTRLVDGGPVISISTVPGALSVGYAAATCVGGQWTINRSSCKALQSTGTLK